jgi:hypothetical protein
MVMMMMKMMVLMVMMMPFVVLVLPLFIIVLIFKVDYGKVVLTLYTRGLVARVS